MTGPIYSNFNSPNNSRASPTGSTRPSGEPSGSKNFEKVMRKDGRSSDGNNPEDDRIGKKDEENAGMEEQGLAEAAEENSKSKQPQSIFDLSSTGKNKSVAQSPLKSPLENALPEELLVAGEESKPSSSKVRPSIMVSDNTQTEPKGSLFSAKPPEDDGISTQIKDASFSKNQGDGKESESGESGKRGEIASPAPTKRKNSIFDAANATHTRFKEKPHDEFSPEQTNTSSTNVQIQSQHQDPLVNPMGENKVAEPPRDAKMIKDLIDQIVKEMYVVKSGEITDTVVTIRHPPIFEGAQVKMTSFETARGEFNIAFENLSQQAKELLDNRVNREALLLALNKEGYNVHIITTSTTIETPAYIAQAQRGEQEQQGQGKEQQGQQKEQQKEQQKKKG